MLFEKKSIELSIGTLAYYEAGDGDPLLCLHGAGGPRVSKPLHGLSQDRRVVVPVFPGWEDMRIEPDIRSIPALAELIAEFARVEVEDRLDVLGYSFGGWVAAWLPILDPALVDRLILMCPAGIQPDTQGRPKTPEEMQNRLYAHPEKLSAADMPKTSPGDTLNAIAHYMTDQPPYDAALVERLTSIEAATLVICGSDDLIIPEQTSVMLEESIANSRITMIDDAAHAVDIDQPRAVEDAIREFLDAHHEWPDTLENM